MTSIPLEITLHKKERTVEIIFNDGLKTILSCEFLRIFSPSAEMRDSGGKQKIIGRKKDVTITAIEPVGNYAVKLIFDDGHRTGIYTWEILYDLVKHQDKYWQDYLAAVEKL